MNAFDIVRPPRIDLPDTQTLYHRFHDRILNPNRFAQCYEWTEPQDIKPRHYHYGRHFIAGYCTATIATGGIGKSSLTAAEALAMVSGKPLLGVQPPRRCSVWLWSLEEDRDEQRRKIQSCAKHYGLTRQDVCAKEEGKHFGLYADTMSTSLQTTIPTREGIQINEPVFENIEARIINEDIDVLIIDPFISSHQASENDNTAMDLIVKRWCALAASTGAAIHLVHHTRKLNGEQAGSDAARGGRAMVDAVRYARVLNRMTPEEGERAGVDDHRSYLHAQSDKSNLAPPEEASWFKIIGVELENSIEAERGYPARPSDKVGVVTRWSWPDAFDGITVEDLVKVQRALDGQQARENVQAKDWAGQIVADVLEIDIADKAGKQRVKTMLNIWIKSGALKVSKIHDENRRERPIIEVGEWAHDI